MPWPLPLILYTLQVCNSPLHSAAWRGHASCVECLLSTPGIDVNATTLVCGQLNVNIDACTCTLGGEVISYPDPNVALGTSISTLYISEGFWCSKYIEFFFF